MLTTSKKLGLPFDEEFTISFGTCPSILENDEKHLQFGVPSPNQAHTHVCKYDPYYLTICLYDESFLRNSDGTPTQTLMHEYAHVLHCLEAPRKVLECGESVSRHIVEDTPEEQKDWGDTGHGLKWQEIMKRLGQEPTLYVLPPY